jgi:hypothetical protein
MNIPPAMGHFVNAQVAIGNDHSKVPIPLHRSASFGKLQSCATYKTAIGISLVPVFKHKAKEVHKRIYFIPVYADTQ